MKTLQIRDKERIEAILRRNPRLHLYELGDLDDFFWPDTNWHILDIPQPTAVALLYTAPALPVLVGLAERPSDELNALLRELTPQLPSRVYAHLSDGAVETLAQRYQSRSHGVHLRMALTDPAQLAEQNFTGIEQLSPADLPEIRKLYQTAYPGNWFEPRMLETGCYFGIRLSRKDGPDSGQLVSIAGVHVYSASYRVAALGNVATLPEFRGQGLAARVCARLCRHLLETTEHVGLNVRHDNAAAIACYQRLGFSRVAVFEEFDLVS
jgi:ribosomal protein S18 acetylase RimI-like enzyme